MFLALSFCIIKRMKFLLKMQHPKSFLCLIVTVLTFYLQKWDFVQKSLERTFWDVRCTFYNSNKEFNVKKTSNFLHKNSFRYFYCYVNRVCRFCHNLIKLILCYHGRVGYDNDITYQICSHDLTLSLYDHRTIIFRQNQ